MQGDDPATTAWRFIHKEETDEESTVYSWGTGGRFAGKSRGIRADDGAAPVMGTNWVAISAAFGMALAAFGGALAQSRVASAACEGMARNPGAAGAIRAAMILGLVFIETLALLTLVIIFAKV